MNKVDNKYQYGLAQEILEDTGINIVTCGNCGHIFLHRLDDNLLTCPHCLRINEPCDCPDLFYQLED